MEFIKKYVLMLGAPTKGKVAHWILFLFSVAFILWGYNGDVLFVAICGYIFFGFWLVHALYLRYRYDKKMSDKHFTLPADQKKETHLRVQVIVHGKVQNVYFREDTKNEAIRIGVGGWVRNLPDRTVQALFEGEKDKVVEIIEWCHRGTEYARVDKVDISWEPYQGEFKQFDIDYN